MNVLLIDANAVGHSSNQTRVLRTADGEPTQAVFHSIKAIWNACKQYPTHTPLILWDSHCQWRFDLLPEYKGKRAVYKKQREDREMYQLQKPAIIEAFQHMGLTQVRHEGYEADDIAGVYAGRITDMEDSNAVLITGDKDWLQLVSENVSWSDLRTGNIVTVKNFERETGFESAGQFLLAKALQGDSSDNIPGVDGFGEKTIAAVMRKYGTIKQLLRDYAAQGEFEKGYFDDPTLSRARKKINAFCSNKNGGQDVLLRNLKLMNLLKITPPRTGFFRQRKEPDIEAFKELCLRHDMLSLVRKAEVIFEDIKRS